MLLVRALVSTFWKQPFDGGLVRWGTALHDRFLLPHFVKQDFCDVLAQLRHVWVRVRGEVVRVALRISFSEDRIDWKLSGVELELRQALEPWNVLAEETVSGRTVRTRGFVAGADAGEAVRVHDGVALRGDVQWAQGSAACHGVSRRSAWRGCAIRARRLSAALHPTIPVHAPLVFEIIDLWNERSHWAMHVSRGAAGRAHLQDVGPSNAAEAEDRRKERFQKSDYRRRQDDEFRRKRRNPIFPMTLDMRCAGARARDRDDKPGRSDDDRSLSDSAALRSSLRRVVGGWHESASALGAPDGVAAGDRARRNWSAAGAGPSAAFARTASRTTSTAIRWGRDRPVEASTSCRC